MPAYFSYSVSLYTDSVFYPQIIIKYRKSHYSPGIIYISVTFINFQDTPPPGFSGNVPPEESVLDGKAADGKDVKKDEE